MSLVEIVEHNEVIFQILDEPPPPPPQTPRYESKLEKQLRETKVQQRHCTMGYADTPLNLPSHFLRKGDGIPQPIKTAPRKCEKDSLPPIPRRDQFVKKEIKPNINFRVLNVKKAIKSKPKQLEPRIVDTKNGQIQKIKDSGEVPQYALRKNFGQTPKYILRARMKMMKEIEEQMKEEEQRESLCKLVSEEERQRLLKDLKSKREHMQKVFIHLPILTDTIPKIMKKSKMEQELSQLEKDIAFIEMNPYIYVYDDN